MLTVAPSCRRLGLGVRLAAASIEAMWAAGCAEAVLEAELSNVAALRLYRGLGFFRDKLLMRYYLGGQDAVRLKLLAPPRDDDGEGAGEAEPATLPSEENAVPQALPKGAKQGGGQQGLAS